jgi:AsmA protein
MKFIKRLLIGIVVLGLIVFFGVPALVGTTWAKDKVKSSLEKETGREVTLGEVSFSWFDGLTVSDVSVAQKAPEHAKEGPLFSMGKMSLRVGIGDVLKKKISVEEFTIEKPKIVVIRDADGRFNFQDLMDRPSKEKPDVEPKDGKGPEIAARLDIEKGDVLYIDVPFGTRVEMAGIDTQATWVNGRLELDMTFNLNGGKAVVKGGLDLSKDPAPFELEEFTIDGATLDANLAQLGLFLPLMGDKPQKAGGTVGFSLTDLSGIGFTLGELANSLTAKGDIKVEGGLVASGVVSQITSLLTGGKSGDGLDFKLFGSSFTIANGRIETKDMKLEGKSFNLGLSGWTDLNGNIDYRISVSKLDDLLAKNKKIKDWMGKDGLVPLHLTGTLSSPQVAVDLEGAIQGAIDSGIERGLDSLLGGKKDDDEDDEEKKRKKRERRKKKEAEAAGGE